MNGLSRLAPHFSYIIQIILCALLYFIMLHKSSHIKDHHKFDLCWLKLVNFSSGNWALGNWIIRGSTEV